MQPSPPKAANKLDKQPIQVSSKTDVSRHACYASTNERFRAKMLFEVQRDTFKELHQRLYLSTHPCHQQDPGEYAAVQSSASSSSTGGSSTRRTFLLHAVLRSAGGLVPLAKVPAFYDD